MEPQEKAKELVGKLYDIKLYNQHAGGNEEMEHAKQCALIAVGEILNNFGLPSQGYSHYANYSTIQYYEEVKTEIEKL